MAKLTDIEIIAAMPQEEKAALTYDPAVMLPIAREYVKTWRNHGGDVQPTLIRLSLILGVSQNTITNWQKKFPEFTRVCEEITAQRALVLSNMGLTGEFKEGITKMQLAHCETNSWINQSKVDNVSTDGSMSPQKEVDPTLLARKVAFMMRDEMERQKNESSGK